MKRQNGQIILIIIFLTVLIIASVVGYFYYRQIPELGFINLNLPFLQKSDFSDVADWKQFTTENQKISYLYPPDWYLFEEQYISQYPFSPRSNSDNVANVVNAVEITSQIQTSYANEDWFNRIYSADPDEIISNDFRPVGQVKLSKLVAGRVRSGQKYVLYTDQQSTKEVNAYILLKKSVYLIKLRLYDSKGLDIFKRIIQTVMVNSD